MISIELRDNSVTVHRGDKKPPLEVAWPDFQEYIAGLSTEGSASSKVKKMIKMPENLVSASDNLFSPTGAAKVMTLHFPESRALVKFQKAEYPNVLFPETGMELGFKKVNAAVGDNRLYLDSTKIWMIHNELRHRYPFPNVFPDSRVCWGHVSLPEFVNMDDYSGAGLYFAAFKSAAFNTDLTPTRSSRFSNNHAFFTYLSTAKEFPYADVT